MERKEFTRIVSHICNEINPADANKYASDLWQHIEALQCEKPIDIAYVRKEIEVFKDTVFTQSIIDSVIRNIEKSHDDFLLRSGYPKELLEKIKARRKAARANVQTARGAVLGIRTPLYR